MELIKYTPGENGIIRINSSTTTELKPYEPIEALTSPNKIELIMLAQGKEEAAKVISSYLLQANIGLDKASRMEVEQMRVIAMRLVDKAYNFTIEELSNIIIGGTEGRYGTFYKFNLPTIGVWMDKYQEQDRKQAQEEKAYYQEKKNEEATNELYGGLGVDRLEQMREALKPRQRGETPQHKSNMEAYNKIVFG